MPSWESEVSDQEQGHGMGIWGHPVGYTGDLRLEGKVTASEYSTWHLDKVLRRVCKEGSGHPHTRAGVVGVQERRPPDSETRLF